MTKQDVTNVEQLTARLFEICHAPAPGGVSEGVHARVPWVRPSGPGVHHPRYRLVSLLSTAAIPLGTFRDWVTVCYVTNLMDAPIHVLKRRAISPKTKKKYNIWSNVKTKVIVPFMCLKTKITYVHTILYQLLLFTMTDLVLHGPKTIIRSGPNFGLCIKRLSSQSWLSLDNF